MKKIEYTESDLEYNSFVWRMPKSNELFLIIRVSGIVNSNNLIREKRCFINYLEKVKLFDYYFTTVLVDFSGETFQNIQGLDFLPEESIKIAKYAGVVINSGAIPSIDSGYYVYESLELGLSELSYLNRKKRFDGGVKILKPQDVIKINDKFSKYEIDIEKLEIDLYEMLSHNNSFYLKVSGYYPRGSAGKAEGKLVGRKIREVMRDFSPKGLIIDFSELDYEWGNDIEIYPWQLKRIEKPLQFVFNDYQLKYFSFKLKNEESRISFDVEEACNKLSKMIGT